MRTFVDAGSPPILLLTSRNKYSLSAAFFSLLSLLVSVSRAQLKQLKHLWLDDNDFEEFPGVILGLGASVRLSVRPSVCL